MDESDRRLRALLILVGTAVLGAGMWFGVVRYYRVDSAAQAQHEDQLERIRQANEMAEDGPVRPRSAPAFSGTLTETQIHILVESLSQQSGQVVLRPAGAGSEGSAVSPTASRAAAELLAQAFWKAGWDARLLEPGTDRKWYSPGLTVVSNPDPPSGRGQQAAQVFIAALDKAGIRVRRTNSYRVDPETFEVLVTVEARP